MRTGLQQLQADTRGAHSQAHAARHLRSQSGWGAAVTAHQHMPRGDGMWSVGGLERDGGTAEVGMAVGVGVGAAVLHR